MQTNHRACIESNGLVQVSGAQGQQGAGYQPSAAAAAAAFGQGSNPFGAFSAQQASQFAAVLAQAQVGWLAHVPDHASGMHSLGCEC